jgi:Zn finger protein HypA/HybF involved in hydrogenase expression
MYICENTKCRAVFGDEYIKTTSHQTEYEPAEYDALCPECGGCDYSDAILCEICEEWFFENAGEIYADICHACASDALTVERGIAYIEDEENNRVNSSRIAFYVEHVFQSECAAASAPLVELCKREWLGTSNKLRDLQVFISEDLDHWKEWLRNNI